MRTLLEAILNKCKVTIEDANETVKYCVLQEDESAECHKTSNGYSIESGSKRLGRGKTEDEAWEDAIFYILDI